MATSVLPMKWSIEGYDDGGLPLMNVTVPDEEPDSELHVVITGDHSAGNIRLPDGTVYDVTPPLIRVASNEHAGLTNHLIGVQHENAKRRGFSSDSGGSRHVCNELCGELARPVTPGDAYSQQQALLASASAEAAASNGVTAITAYSNLHSASPGTTGANELGSTRQSTAWTTANSGSPNPSNSSGLSYSLAASTTASHIGGWSAVSAGTYSVGFVLAPSVTTGSSAGTVTVATGALAVNTT